MRISECRVKILDQAPMRAIASITLDDQFVVKGIRILDIQNRLMVCMPSRRGPDGEHRDVAHPVNSRVRQMIDSQILATYEEERRRAADDPGSVEPLDAEEQSFCTPAG